MKLILGDCLDKLKDIDDNSIDSIVTDPPAGISFMNKAWDKDKGDRNQWIKWLESIMVECLRVLKPGGHALVWSLPRTGHWTAFAIENAGFEIRDNIASVFGSGFPKNHSLDDVQEGFGTALKPAHESWWLCRKPISEKRIIDNVLKHGTGGINVDGTRVGLNGEEPPTGSGAHNNGHTWTMGGNQGNTTSQKGRWPSNFIMSHDEGCELIGKEISENKPYEYKDKKYEVKGFVAECKPNSPSNYNDQTGGRIYKCVDGCPIKMMDEQSGETGSHGSKTTKTYENDNGKFLSSLSSYANKPRERSIGTASRFFPNFTPEYEPFHYFAKASVSERNDGLEGMDKKPAGGLNASIAGDTRTGKVKEYAENTHPTIKSLSLMRWLITLITPPKGIVLDPFMGSGSTGIAAIQLEFDFIGIEKEPEYMEIAKKRIDHAKNPHGQMGLF